MIVFASQHVYGSVHANESPAKKEGYQTIFYTNAGLTTDEVHIIEQHTQCSPTAETRKYQYYLLPSGKAVITQVMTLPDNDPHTHDHLFFSHALVISAEDYKHLARSPLGLFTPNHFFHRIEDAYSEGDFQTGDIPQKKLVSLSAWEDLALKSAQDWQPEHLIRLVRFGWQAKQLRANRQPVILTGSTNHIFRSLAVIFLLTAIEKRHLLTFDTNADGCSFGDGWPFWAIGATQNNASSTAYRVDADAMHTHGNLPASHDSPIERWIAERSIPSRLANYIAELDQTQLLSELLSGQTLRRDILINLNEDIVKGFTEMNPDAVVNLVLSHLPSGLSQKLTGQIAADVRSAPYDYATWAASGLSKENQAEYLFHLLLTLVKDAIPPADRKILENLSVESKHTGLYSLINLLAHDFKHWERSLEFIAQEHYHHIVQAVLAQQVMPASDILYPPYLESWAKEVRHPFQPGEFKSILGFLNKHRGQYQADHLQPLLKLLTPPDREQLARWLQSHAAPAPQLRAALGLDESSSGDSSSKLKNLFSRGKD
ncbi:MAG TPA: hypothetical protein VLH85_02850 [Levilinea sp.]|nr:hypothetical protein [Levilinea sp.]